MPYQPSFFSRVFSWLRRSEEHENNRIHGDDGQNGDVFSPVECYACTQVGVPVFHSASYDGANPPEWEASAGSSLVPIQPRKTRKTTRFSRPGHVLDPRSKRVQRWNRALLLVRGTALALDPLFFYALSVGVNSHSRVCLYLDGAFAAAVTTIRTCVDAVHLCHMWLQFRTAYVSRESLVIGCGKLVWDPRAVVAHYVRSLKGFWFDVVVVLPVPQVVFWLIVPKLIKEEKIELQMTILLLIFMFQFVPKVYHCICLMRRMQQATGYIFGSIWWGFGLNLIAYFIASHYGGPRQESWTCACGFVGFEAAGGIWYVLAIQQVASCLRQRCERASGNCNFSLSCSPDVCYKFFSAAGTIGNNPCNASNSTVRKPLCLDVNGPFNYGIYQSALPVISSNSLSIKILYSIFWGLISLSMFGNDLEPTSHWLEVLFSICIVLGGLLLFTLLIGNIQVVLHSVMAKKRKMQLRCRDMERWMKRRQLPSRLRQRVRLYELLRWTVLGGEEEAELVKDLPLGLRRDIKRYLCLDMINKVPLFHNLDDLILDNICDRARRLVFSKNEKIIREGDPVQRMIFIMRGRAKRSQSLSRGVVATNVLDPGGFLGDELLSWCLRRPFIDRLPASTATFVCVEAIEAFALESDGLRYITDHFRYKFANERLKRTARYYSSNWRTWAAVNIQLAWRRHRARTRSCLESSVPENSGSDQQRLLQYAAMFMSIRPHDHLD